MAVSPPRDLRELTHADFERCLGQRFVMGPDSDERAEVVLVAVETRGAGTDPEARAPFFVRFRGPSQPVLAQSIRRLESECMGSMDLFLVPVGPDPEGMLYEAVFT